VIVNGGAIRNNEARSMSSGTSFVNNAGNGCGGGIFSRFGTVTINGGEISGNRAGNTDSRSVFGGDGGGIFMVRMNNLTINSTNNSVRFFGNRADAASWMTAPADISMHNQSITGMQQPFSNPPQNHPAFAYLYNNYDVGYVRTGRLSSIIVRSHADLVRAVNIATANRNLEHIIEIDASFDHNSVITIPASKNITLRDHNKGGERILTVRNGNPRHFTVEGTLRLLDNITLTNRNTTQSGGGVVVNNNGRLYLDGAKITGNAFVVSGSTARGGGVIVNTGGTFTMERGEISGNLAFNTHNNSRGGNGGGIFSEGTVVINGGAIKNNEARSTNAATTFPGTASNGNGNGGGIFSGNGTVTINGGEISGNRAGIIAGERIMCSGSGGGVFVRDIDRLTEVSDTVIFRDNTAEDSYNFIDANERHSIYVYRSKVKVEDGRWSVNTDPFFNGETMGGNFKYGFNNFDIGFQLYTIIFSPNDGISGTETSRIVFNGDPAGELPSIANGNAPTRENYKFVGWSNISGIYSFVNFHANSIIERSITVYAVWERSEEMLKVTDVTDLHFGQRHMPRNPIESYSLPIASREGFNLEVTNTSNALQWEVVLRATPFRATNNPVGTFSPNNDTGDPIDGFDMIAYPRGLVNVPATRLSQAPATIYRYDASDTDALPPDGIHNVGWHQLLKEIEVRVPPGSVEADTEYRAVHRWSIVNAP
jgi:hypothetical protein